MGTGQETELFVQGRHACHIPGSRCIELHLFQAGITIKRTPVAMGMDTLVAVGVDTLVAVGMDTLVAVGMDMLVAVGMFWFSRTCSELATEALAVSGLPGSPCPVPASTSNNLISPRENQSDQSRGSRNSLSG